MPLSVELRVACEADANEISALVNRAYRPEPGAAGWTHEAKLVAGERIRTAQVLSQIQGPSTILLLCLGPRVVACVQVERDQSDVYIGMLATEPHMQAQGLGKQMLLCAEEYAVEHFDAPLLKMSVLSSRPELLAFYERRGYALTGVVEEYPLTANVGRPMIDGVQVLSLAKVPESHPSDRLRESTGLLSPATFPGS
jgi:GNAT superfamily N-acetyltransferase